MSIIHGLRFQLSFEQGISVGCGSSLNILEIDRDGLERPVLRGTSLAGILRSRLQHDFPNNGDSPNEPSAAGRHWFGYAVDGDQASTQSESVVRIADSVLNLPTNPTIRTHHTRNRHTGVVAQRGLFSLESCPPGTDTHCTLWIREPATHADDIVPANVADFLAWLNATLQDGILVGGRKARGIGLGRLVDGSITYYAFDLSDPKQYANRIQVDRAWREGTQCDLPSRPLQVSGPATSGKALCIQLELGIPPGQDILVAEGTLPTPMRVATSQDKQAWLIPGSSFRGLFRDWFNRLAAREGHCIADSNEHYQALKSNEQLAHPDPEWLGEHPKCPVNQLFGTTSKAGRIYLSDAIAPAKSPPGDQLQLRKHVAIDRVSGGAAEGLLFENEVLISGGPRAPRFKMEIRIQAATEDEARWLGMTLTSLHRGLLRIGSSKASGRLQLVAAPVVKGVHAATFTQNAPSL